MLVLWRCNIAGWGRRGCSLETSNSRVKACDMRLVIPRKLIPGPRSSIHTLEFLFPPPLKYHGVPQLTAISTIENVRFHGLFFFLDRFFLDRWKKKCFYREFPWSHPGRSRLEGIEWQPTSQTWCFDGVVYSTCDLLPNPIKILLQLWPFAFPCTFTCFFLTYDGGNLRQKCFSFHISKIKIYLPLCVVCNSAIYSELQCFSGGHRGPGYH